MKIHYLVNVTPPELHKIKEEADNDDDLQATLSANGSEEAI